MIPVDAEVMLAIAPRFSGALAETQAAICRAAGEVLGVTLAAYGIDTRLRIAHFLAQTCHESAGFRTTEEFASGEAYEGRLDLGNTQPGDGVRYKGRGLLQLTGRANYRKYGRALGIDLEADPVRAAEPRLSLRIACEYWNDRNLNAMCDGDDLIRATRAINGGLNGLDDRRALTTRAKAVLARIEGIRLAGTAGPADGPILRRGSTGEEVADLQGLLRRHGFPLVIDGDYGAATELAVMRLQQERRLTVDGIVGPQTWKSLRRVQRRPARKTRTRSRKTRRFAPPG